MQISNLKLDNDLILAPLAGINDIAFRRMCRESGAGLIYTGMYSIDSINLSEQARDLIITCEEEKPVAIQLFGRRVDYIKKAVQFVEPLCDVIDFNFGCPDRNVVKQRAGSSLLLEPELMGEIVREIRKWTEKPVTAKIRAGFERVDLDKTIEICRILEKSGADAITIHPRCQKQGYRGKAEWSIIKECKKTVSIPIIGNGDVKTSGDVTRMRQETKCDAVMIGRAAMGNPAIFSGKKPDLKLALQQYSTYLKYCELYGIDKATYIRMQGQFFLKGFEGASAIRKQLGVAKELSDIHNVIDSVKF